MAGHARITLEQWRAFQAVVEGGSYARAAEILHKSQSTITYAVQQIQSLLDLKVFEIQGRKAVLTDAGQVLYRRARTLLEEAAALERGAAEMADDWQPELRIAVEVIFPTWLLLECLAEFAEVRPETRVEVYETARSGTNEMLKSGAVDFAIGEVAGPDAIALPAIHAGLVASPDHPLHRLGRPVTERDLKRHRRIFIRDTGSQRQVDDVGGVELRWTVSQKATAIRALVMGLGFAWQSLDIVREELRAGTLKVIPLKAGTTRVAHLYLTHADPEFPGRDASFLADLLVSRLKAESGSDRDEVRVRSGPGS
jgi:DNA-binding transcriptional LysR family regulator